MFNVKTYADHVRRRTTTYVQNNDCAVMQDKSTDISTWTKNLANAYLVQKCNINVVGNAPDLKSQNW